MRYKKLSLSKTEKLPKFGLKPATWFYEGGIASNRSSKWSGEYVRFRVQTARQALKVGYSGIYRDFFFCIR